jgi:hypothetical protein
MEKETEKIDIVELNEHIAFEVKMFERLHRGYNKKYRRQEVARINRLIVQYNAIIPKSMKYL